MDDGKKFIKSSLNHIRIFVIISKRRAEIGGKCMSGFSVMEKVRKTYKMVGEIL